MTDKTEPVVKDGEFLADLLVAASKLLAQEAVYIRYHELGKRKISNDCVGTLNAAVRCQMLAEQHRKGSVGFPRKISTAEVMRENRNDRA